jgi:hypothetical protein
MLQFMEIFNNNKMIKDMAIVLCPTINIESTIAIN